MKKIMCLRKSGRTQVEKLQEQFRKKLQNDTLNGKVNNDV